MKNFTVTLQASLRRENDFVARYGGREFIMLISQMPRDERFVMRDLICAKVEEMLCAI